jgi:hypothetical protein
MKTIYFVKERFPVFTGTGTETYDSIGSGCRLNRNADGKIQHKFSLQRTTRVCNHLGWRDDGIEEETDTILYCTVLSISSY